MNQTLNHQAPDDTAPVLPWRRLAPEGEATIADFPDGFGSAVEMTGGGGLPLILFFSDLAEDIPGGLWKAPRAESREAAQRSVEQGLHDGNIGQLFTKATDPGPDADPRDYL